MNDYMSKCNKCLSEYDFMCLLCLKNSADVLSICMAVSVQKVCTRSAQAAYGNLMSGI